MHRIYTLIHSKASRWIRLLSFLDSKMISLSLRMFIDYDSNVLTFRKSPLKNVKDIFKYKTLKCNGFFFVIWVDYKNRWHDLTISTFKRYNDSTKLLFLLVYRCQKKNIQYQTVVNIDHALLLVIIGTFVSIKHV